MSKNIQLPESVLRDLYMLTTALADYELDNNTRNIADRLETLVYEKLEAFEKRQLYTAYKNAPNPKDRVLAYHKYLDFVNLKDELN